MNLLTKASQAIPTQSKNDSYVVEYNLPLDSMELIVSHINGSYPEEGGFDIDETVDQIWYVESGKGTVFIQETEYTLEQGDMILIPKNEKYWIKGDHLKLIVASNPKWHAGQHKHLAN
jgi:mannose-6-phosphate isomerase-like protein (cupin superfamily)